jgi:hypothetical protein
LWTQNFPFDYHDLRIAIRSHKLDKTKCELVVWSETTAMEAQLEQNEWQVLGHRADHLETDPSSSSTGKVYSELHICESTAACAICFIATRPITAADTTSSTFSTGVLVGRYPQWYIGNVLSFVFGLGILGFALLALPVEKVAQTC